MVLKILCALKQKYEFKQKLRTAVELDCKTVAKL